jgi:hypothetical protein
MQRWEKVRAQGRDRFLLLSVGRGYGLLVGGVLVELLWWLFTKKAPEPLLAAAAKWVLVWIGAGVVMGWHDWQENEAAYKEEKQREPGH